jgi:spore maturation protein SpmB
LSGPNLVQRCYIIAIVIDRIAIDSITTIISVSTSSSSSSTSSVPASRPVSYPTSATVYIITYIFHTVGVDISTISSCSIIANITTNKSPPSGKQL